VRGPAFALETNIATSRYSIYMLQTWLDGAARSFRLSQGLTDPCSLTNEPRVLHFVAAAATTLVSIHYNIQHHVSHEGYKGLQNMPPRPCNRDKSPNHS
jgi:hypothetical protein